MDSLISTTTQTCEMAAILLPVALNCIYPPFRACVYFPVSWCVICTSPIYAFFKYTWNNVSFTSIYVHEYSPFNVLPISDNARHNIDRNLHIAWCRFQCGHTIDKLCLPCGRVPDCYGGPDHEELVYFIFWTIPYLCWTNPSAWSCLFCLSYLYKRIHHLFSVCNVV